jgi:hypothetical protein
MLRFREKYFMKIFNKIKFFIALLIIILMQLVFVPSQGVYAATAPTLGVAAGYSVFGNAGITETAAQNSHLWGDVGDNALGHVSLISSQVGGTLYGIAQPTVVNAIASAYGDLAAAGQGATTPLSLAGTNTVTPGLYDVAAGTLNGTLTLDGAGVYIFRSTSSITVNGSGTMSLVNGACASNVFWQIPTSMTISNAAHMEGTIITNTGLISFVSGASLKGRAWAHTQVTMDNNQITEPTCATPTSTPTPTPTSTSSSSSSSSSSSTSTSVCTEFIPTSNPDLFQIDRAGSTAVLHFTPVNSNMTYYYIAYGLSPGSEQYGVTFPASPSTGAVTYTINDLNPNLTYYFKVRAGNICAPGGWSNNRESNSKNPSLPNTGFDPHPDYSEYRCLSRN